MSPGGWPARIRASLRAITDSPPVRRRAAMLALVWYAAALAHVALSALAPKGILRDSDLSLGLRLLLAATELAAAGGFGLLLAVLLGLWGAAEERAPRPVRWGLRLLRATLVLTLVFLLAGSWAAFWIGGRFLDESGLRFYLGNAGIMASYAAEMHPVASRVLPILVLLTALLLSEALPRWARRTPERSQRAWVAAAVGGFFACALAALGGEVARWSHGTTIVERETGVTFALGEYVEMRRDFRSGPLLHAFLASDKDRSTREDVFLPSAELDLERPALIDRETYLAGVDRSALRPLNVVVVLVDSLRPDQLKAYGGTRDVMPRLNAEAEGARVYLDCTTVGSRTDLAAPAPFTSHYPLRSRAMEELEHMAGYPRVLLYDLLKWVGYRTGFFASNNEFWGGTIHLLRTPSIDHFFTAGLTVPPGAPLSSVRGSAPAAIDDRITIDEALAWLDAGQSGAPFFLYLNLQSGHAPYRVPPGYPRPFGEDPTFSVSAGAYHPELAARVKAIYADSLHYVDQQLARVIDRLKARGDWDRTVFVLTADHGEAFYEHGFAGHGGKVYDEVFRIPMIVRAPGLEPGPDARPVELLDVAPLVCGLLGLPPHPSFQGLDPRRPDFPESRSRYLLSQTVGVRQSAVVRDGWKLIYDADVGRHYLFDLRNDPGETRDRAEVERDRLRDLVPRLHGWRRAQIEYYEDRSRWAREYPPRLRR